MSPVPRASDASLLGSGSAVTTITCGSFPFRLRTRLSASVLAFWARSLRSVHLHDARVKNGMSVVREPQPGKPRDRIVDDVEIRTVDLLVGKRRPEDNDIGQDEVIALQRAALSSGCFRVKSSR